MIIAIIIFGLVIYSCCVVAGEEDERMECTRGSIVYDKEK